VKWIKFDLKPGFAFLHERLDTLLSIGMTGAIADALTLQFELGFQRVVEGLQKESL
jgi:hypothetical protein